MNQSTTKSFNRKKAIAVNPCDTNINRTLKLVDEMIALADQGDVEREDVGCGIMYGILRDAAYRLKKIAEQEKKAHQQKGWWHETQ
jgi:hypothetical protein